LQETAGESGVKTLRERFEEKYVPEPNSGCWLWDACILKSGYGQIKAGDKVKYAHRVSYEIYIGKIPSSKFVCHACDTPSCVNPDHLWLGTHNDNMLDMMTKDRSAKGERSAAAKLTEEQVREIRFDSRVQQTIAEEHGVDQTLISQIKLGKIWKHIV